MHLFLQELYSQATSSSKLEPSDVVVIRAQVPSRLDRGGSDEDGNPIRSVSVRLFVSYTARSGSLHDVTVSVTAPSPVSCRESVFTLPTLSGGDGTAPTALQVRLCCNDHVCD
jgi:hypothetical protein